jgi:phosphatidylglycerol lysyltransferase
MEPAERARLLELLGAHAVNPLSFLVHYGEAWEAFLTDDGGAPILHDGRAVLMWADPLGERGEVLAAFTREMRRRRKDLALIAVGLDTALVARSLGYSVLKIGEEPWFDLGTWRRPRGDPGKKLRWCLNRALRGGVAVADFTGERDEVLAVLERWERSLGRKAATSFLAASPLSAVEEKRIFCARADGRLAGFLACSPVYARNGWYLEDLVRDPGAPPGTTELLVVHALHELAAAGASCAALGLVPLRNPRDQLDRRARLLGLVVGSVVRSFDRRYGFRALERYESKFRPSRWEPRYLAFLPALPRPAIMRAVLRTL